MVENFKKNYKKGRAVYATYYAKYGFEYYTGQTLYEENAEIYKKGYGDYIAVLDYIAETDYYVLASLTRDICEKHKYYVKEIRPYFKTGNSKKGGKK